MSAAGGQRLLEEEEWQEPRALLPSRPARPQLDGPIVQKLPCSQVHRLAMWCPDSPILGLSSP